MRPALTATSTATNAVRTLPERHLQRREGISSPRAPAAGGQHLPALRPSEPPAGRLHPRRGAPRAAADGQHFPALRPPELPSIRLHKRPGAPPAASTRGMELPTQLPRRTTPSRPPTTFPRAPSGACLGKRRAKRWEAALLQLRPGQTALESGNRERKGIDSLTKMFLVSVWHSCVRNRCRSCSRIFAKGTLSPVLRKSAAAAAASRCPGPTLVQRREPSASHSGPAGPSPRFKTRALFGW
jgi:hypothetical protein